MHGRFLLSLLIFKTKLIKPSYFGCNDSNNNQYSPKRLLWRFVMYFYMETAQSEGW